MYSSRLAWQTHPNAIDTVLTRFRAARRAYSDLTLSNPTKAGLAYPTEGIVNSFRDPRILSYDPEPAGILVARQQVAELENVDASRVFLTASTSESYSWLFKLLADPGDEILTPAPSYPLFDYLAALEGVRVTQYPLHYDHDWFVDFAAMRARITPRTRAVVLVNPNNPTGSFLKVHEFPELLQICREFSIAIISDEVFLHYGFGDKASRFGSLNQVNDVLTFCLNGLSKYVGMPQMKLGWITVSGPSVLLDSTVSNLTLIADTYLSVSTPAQYAVSSLLKAGETVRHQICKRLRTNLDLLTNLIREAASVSLLQLEGGWTAILRVPRTRSEEEWVLHLLEEQGVLVQPGYFYDFESEAYLVVSLLPETNVFQSGLAGLIRGFNAP